MHVFKHLRRQQAKLDKDPAKQVRAPCCLPGPLVTGPVAHLEQLSV